MIWKIIALIASRPSIRDWLIKRAKRTPYTHIYGPDGSLYMERYWLFNAYPGPGKKKNWFPLSIRLHKIMRKDTDRHDHDHPWHARTIILQRGYEEVREGVYFLRAAGDTAKLRYGEYHRITWVHSAGVWTLFITGKYRGTWGFKVNGVKVPYREYLGLNK